MPAPQVVPTRFPLLCVTLVRGTIRTRPDIKEAIRILGLRRPFQTVYHRNNAATRGNIKRVCTS